MTYYFVTPWATSGDVVTIPQPVQPSGEVSFTQGYGPNYQIPIGSSGALAPERQEFNELMNLITTALQQYQQWGTPDFITSADNLGVPFPYSKGARVLKSGNIYESLVNSNTTTPPGANWSLATGFNPVGIQNNTFTFAVDSGVANAYVANPVNAYQSMAQGQRITVLITHSNTGNSTLDVSSNGAATIKKQSNAGAVSLIGGELLNGQFYDFESDGTNWIVLNPSMPSSIATNGYTYLPNGLLIQWGSYLLTAPGAPTGLAIITFPISFPNNVFTITTSYGEDADPTFLELTTQAKPIDNNTFKFAIGTCGTSINITKNIPLQWIAIGN